ncbi:MAG: GNAT family N-acetyltransferase [Chloroflexota bacterium]|nr:GNAT family N-acetyltransferase [Chloroflexota bacterium]
MNAETWPDLERLFEARGGPKWCWCSVFRRDATGRRPKDRAGQKALLEGSARGGVPVGLLAYHDGEPVAWCSVGPRETFAPLGGVNGGEPPDAVWSITCFYVRSAYARRGVMRALIDAATAYAARNGAAVVEAYPVPPDTSSYRFMGFTPAFADVGFAEAGRAGKRRAAREPPRRRL